MDVERQRLTILNFDDIYTLSTSLLKQFPYQWVNVKDIPHTNLYCEKKALKAIKHRLATISHNLALLGNGNYHYMTYLFLSKIKTPFTLILFDHHSDMAQSSHPFLLSCGNWVSYALSKLPSLKRVILIGATKEQQKNIPFSLFSKVTRLSPESKHKLASLIPTKDIYISIDKDVLHPDDAQTNWDHGSLPLKTLLADLEQLKNNNHIIGADVCGEMSYLPTEQFNLDYKENILKNERANVAILNCLTDE